MMTMDVPTLGEPITVEHAEAIAEVVAFRQLAFDGEPIEMSVMVAVMNAGDGWTEVTSFSGDWSGRKNEIPRREDGGIPLSPTGQPMVESPKRIRLGWVETEVA